MTRGRAPDDSVRAFLALELPAAFRVRLGVLCAELRPSLDGVRWVRPEGIHLTLRFLGATSSAAIERLSPAVSQAAALCPPSRAPVRGLGVFPDRGSPRVLWLGLSVAEPVLTLQGACEAAAVRAGFEAEPRTFRAHLTLGRWRARAKRPPLPTVDLGDVHLDTLVLFRSQPGPGGSVYTALARFPLGAPMPS